MPDPKQQYIDEHIDDPELCAQIPDYKRRLHELERQFIAGKLRPPNTTESAPAEDGTTGPDDAAASEDQPEPGPDGAGIEELNDALGKIADAPDGDAAEHDDAMEDVNDVRTAIADAPDGDVVVNAEASDAK